VRSGRPSLLDSARFLWAISPEVWESGVRGRLGTIRTRCSSPSRTQAIPEGAVLLVDHNPSKVQHAERVFGSAVTLVEPACLAHRLRCALFSLVLVCAPGRARGGRNL
jgi:hypothetical protein